LLLHPGSHRALGDHLSVERLERPRGLAVDGLGRTGRERRAILAPVSFDSEFLAIYYERVMAQDDKETREQRRRRQVEEIHAALGRYVEAFELVVHWIRGGCVILISQKPQQQRLMNVVFNHRSMTAEPLFQIYRALVGEIVNDQDTKFGNEERKAILGVLQQIGREFQSAVQKRNDFLHGTWFIGWGNEKSEDWSSIGFMRLKSTNDGLASIQGPKSAKDIDILTKDCKQLADFFSRLHSCILLDLMKGEEKTRVTRNFRLSGAGKSKKWIVKQPAT
jgi:hypothetical protein